MPTPNQTTVLITGAANGFGRDAVFALAKMNYQVIATTETEDQAAKLLKSVNRLKLPITVYKLDLTSEQDRAKILKHPIDILVNNAGIGESGSLAEIPLDRVRRNFDVNLFGPLALTQLILPQMIKRKQGKIIFISSLAGRAAIPFIGAYCMTKFAVSCGADALRHELALLDANVWVSVIEPGAYHTGFNQRMFATKYQWMNKQSLFALQLPQIKAREEQRFAIIELASTKSLICQIIKAVQAAKPRLRYSAPWWQAWGVALQRILGK
ncbi:MAG: SDR family NAD(P)-dependent oxidoreductase [Candidatus Falkowbacteria bacterium]